MWSIPKQWLQIVDNEVTEDSHVTSKRLALL